MLNHNICVTQSSRLPRSKAQILPFIWDIKNIEYCEVKADRVSVTKDTDRSGTYLVEGRFARYIPWHRIFSYELHDRGFHSKEAQQPPSRLNIQGGFFVEQTGEDEAEIIHYEQYTLPTLLMPLKPLIVLYLKWSQKKEMADLKKLILDKTAA